MDEDNFQKITINGQSVMVPLDSVFIDKADNQIDNEHFQWGIEQGRFKRLSNALKHNPSTISEKTFSMLADFLLSLPEKGKPGRKPNKTKQLEIVSNHETKRGKAASPDPQKHKRIKANGRQAKKRLKDKETAQKAARVKRWEEFQEAINPKTKGINVNLNEIV